MQFDSGYLSPYFVTDPEAWKLPLRTPTFSFTKSKLVPSRTCSRY